MSQKPHRPTQVYRGISLLLAALVLLQTPVHVWASGAGTTGASILKMGVGARAIAMGEAYTAQADDASSVYWNPAGLGLLDQAHASFMHNPFIEDQAFSTISVGLPLQSGGVGFTASYLDYGSIDSYDASNLPKGEQSAYSGTAGVGAAWATDVWSMGVTVKGVREKIADVSATTLAGDLGAMVIYPKSVLGGTFRAGATYRHLGQGLKFISERDPLPSEWRLGVAGTNFFDGHLNLSADYGQSRDEDRIASVGAELWATKWIAFRAGYVKQEAEGNGIRAGLGLKVGSILFDYAFESLGDLGLSHRYELGILFGEERTKLAPEERKLLQQAKKALKADQYEEAILFLDELIRRAPNCKPAYRLTREAMARSERHLRTVREARENALPKDANESTASAPTDSEKMEMDSMLAIGEPGTTQNAAAPSNAQPGEEELP